MLCRNWHLHRQRNMTFAIVLRAVRLPRLRRAGPSTSLDKSALFSCARSIACTCDAVKWGCTRAQGLMQRYYVASLRVQGQQTWQHCNARLPPLSTAGSSGFGVASALGVPACRRCHLTFCGVQRILPVAGAPGAVRVCHSWHGHCSWRVRRCNLVGCRGKRYEGIWTRSLVIHVRALSGRWQIARRRRAQPPEQRGSP